MPSASISIHDRQNFLPLSLLDESLLQLVKLRVFAVGNGNDVDAEILPEMGLGSETEDDRLAKSPENLGTEHHRHFVLHVGALDQHRGLWMGPFLKRYLKLAIGSPRLPRKLLLQITMRDATYKHAANRCC